MKKMTVTNREVFGIRSSIPRSGDSKAELKKQMVRLVSHVIAFPIVNIFRKVVEQ